MSARVVNVRIGRLVVDERLRREASHWGDALERALRAQLTNGPDAKNTAAPTEAHATEAIAQHVARRVSAAVPATMPQPSGGPSAGA